jgi:hypothetical protein
MSTDVGSLNQDSLRQQENNPETTGNVDYNSWTFWKFL